MNTYLFVYNANSGRLSALLDSAHKFFSPHTYQCRLCDITYGIFREREEWKRFREQIPHTFIFLHRDEFECEYPPQLSYPIILKLEESSEFTIVMDMSEINRLHTEKEFIQRLGELLP